MFGNIVVLNEVLILMVVGKVKEVGVVVEVLFGWLVMGKYCGKLVDVWFGLYMLLVMYGIGMDGYQVVSEFVKVVVIGDCDKVIVLLFNFIGVCVGCHFFYWI